MRITFNSEQEKIWKINLSWTDQQMEVGAVNQFPP